MKKLINISLKPILILLAYPILLAVILEIIIQGMGFSVLLNFSENILFAVLIFFTINLSVQLKYGKKIANILILTFYAILFIETGLFLLFQTRFNASYIYVILNSNLTEMMEFSAVYYRNNLFWLFLFFIPVLPAFPKKIYRQVKGKAVSIFASLILIVFIFSILIITKLIVYNLPYISIKSYIQYNDQIESINAYKVGQKQITVNTLTSNDAIIVAIGESATSKHMGLYGYYRETNPELNKMADSLIIYKDVISSQVYTTASIYEIFTLSNYEDPKSSPSLMNFIKSAGYKVYWLSNHRPVGFHDNLVSRLASEADESIFLNYNDYRNKTSYDEVLLPKLREKLSSDGRKVIFVHLTGNHYAYENRYPENFNKFSSEKNNKKTKIIDTYDNAILYTDFVLGEMIKLVQEKNEKSALLYFSDHGEEVFDTVDFFGHFDDKPTPTMYEVPFLVYMTPDFEKPADFQIDESRAYMLDDFPHSLTHFMGIQSELLDSKKSLFSSEFKPRKRMIKDSLDFDMFKLKSTEFQ